MSRQFGRYMVAGGGIATFFLLLWLARGSAWLLPVVVGWELTGMIWYVYFSYYGEIWRARRRGHLPPLGLVRGFFAWIVALVCALYWPIWLVSGEDVFD